MVKQIEEDVVAKARKVVGVAEKRAMNKLKTWVFEAAKKARKTRLEGKLAPMMVYETYVETEGF